MNKKYVILQGVQSARGCGDLLPMTYTDNLEMGRKLFNHYKNDREGWIISRGEKLVTALMLNKEDVTEYLEYEEK